MVILGNITAAWVCVCLCKVLIHSLFYMPKPSLWKRFALLGGGWVLLGTVSCLTDNVLFIALAAMAVAVFTCWLAGQARPIAVIGFGLMFGVLRLCSFGAALFLRQVFPGIGDACAIMADILILFAAAVCISAVTPRWRSSAAPLLWLIPVWLTGVVLCTAALYFRNSTLAVAPVFFGFLWLLYAGVRLIQTCLLMDATVQAYRENQQAVRHYALQEEYYQQLVQKQAETRALWHDLHKYLRAAKAESPTSQALSQMESLLDSATEIVDVGNRVLNVILNEYAQAAKTTDTELRLKVQVPETLFVTAADLYVMIGNTLDNALEACKDLTHGNRLIDLTLRMHNDVLYYKVVNPYNKEAQPLPRDPGRGYGLQNVRRCMERYHGNMEIFRQDGFFTVSLYLNRP